MNYFRHKSSDLPLSLCCMVFLTLFLFSCSAKSSDTEEGPTEAPFKNSFTECVSEGGEILRSYPAKCVSSDGTISVDSPAQFKKEGEARNHVQSGDSQARPLCIDVCGDKVCQQIVCLGTGCSCAETPQSCPKDCAKQAGF